MRFIFVKELIKYAKKNKNVYLITSDLGYRAFEEFKSLFPKRFINVGVAENNMIGISAGLALSGKKVFVYSILPFLIFRSLEQIRNNICHNNLDVTLVGAGGGFSATVVKDNRVYTHCHPHRSNGNIPAQCGAPGPAPARPS